MKKAILVEFRPTIIFLLKFAGIYLIGNLIYGFYITAYYPSCDPASQWVTSQAGALLNFVGYETQVMFFPNRPITSLLHQGKAIVSVYEGCNGLNVAVVFLAFVVAIGPYSKRMVWFGLLGLVIVHISNLLRIIFLYWVTIYLPDFLYYAHKYLFTAFIYFIVFLLWVWWVTRLSRRNPHATQ